MEAIESVGIDYRPERWVAENLPNVDIDILELVISPTTNPKYDVIHVVKADRERRRLWFWISVRFACFFK